MAEGSVCLYVFVAEADTSACRDVVVAVTVDVVEGSACLFVAEADTSACRGVELVEGSACLFEFVTVVVDVAVEVNEG